MVISASECGQYVSIESPRNDLFPIFWSNTLRGVRAVQAIPQSVSLDSLVGLCLKGGGVPPPPPKALPSTRPEGTSATPIPPTRVSNRQ